MCSDQTSCGKILAPTAKANETRVARGVVLAAEPGSPAVGAMLAPRPLAALREDQLRCETG